MTEQQQQQPRQDADGRPFLSYYRNDEHLAFSWSGLPDSGIEVAEGGAGEPVVATFAPPLSIRNGGAYSLREILAHFQLVCDLWADSQQRDDDDEPPRRSSSVFERPAGNVYVLPDGAL